MLSDILARFSLIFSAFDGLPRFFSFGAVPARVGRTGAAPAAAAPPPPLLAEWIEGKIDDVVAVVLLVGASDTRGRRTTEFVGGLLTTRSPGLLGGKIFIPYIEQ